jgi:hypothetical protein
MLKIRCSQIGKIMTNPRSKKETLSNTTKGYLKELIIEQKFGKYKKIKSKFIDKGNEVELEGIALCNEVLETDFLYKNHENFENDYITGTPDVNTTDTLLDIKASWSAFTYFDNFFSDNIPNKDYYYQLMGYMMLTGKKNSILCYCLLNTPSHLVEDEIRREHYQLNAIDEIPGVRKQIENNHNFDNIDNQLRIKTFKVEYDQNVIDKIIERIIECRKYYDKLNELLTIKEIENA